MQAVQLNVDSGGTHPNAIETINAVAATAGIASVESLRAVETPSFFTAFVVIGYDDGVLIQQGRLKTAVRTNEGASLFAEASENAIEHQREYAHEE